MYLSINWLKDFVKLPKGVTPLELGQKLTLHTVEVEKIEDQAQKFDKVVVGKILSVSRHPNADRLQLAEVQIDKKTQLHIVCGAPNIAPGQKVPVALVGSVLPNGLEIKEAEVRGEKSQGMLCAPDELGLGDDHAGILILDDHAKVGEDFARYMGLDDQILEVDNKSLTNRPDLWNHYGMAREISAFLSAKFTPFVANKKVLEKKGDGFELSVKVESSDLCPRYMAVGIEGVTVESSPSWMQKRLLAVGLRPINNIVDITNYVMLELGQPMHAFDQSLVDKIIVRTAKAGEEMETLDGEKRQLDQTMLVIADSMKPVAIAGVMGGGNSEIRPETTKIIFESANFDYVSVRKTSTKMGLRTESSQRFEKGLDPNLCELALARAVELTLQVCPAAKVVTEVIDLKQRRQSDDMVITVSIDEINSKIGLEIKPGRITDILESLGFVVKKEKHNFIITVPTWRTTRDIAIKEDIIEEIARVYGFNDIPATKPLIEMAKPDKNQEKSTLRKVRNLLAGAPGLAEVYNYSFVGEEQVRKLGLEPNAHLSLANPIASDQTLLRQSLAPNLIANVRSNQARFKEFGLFEVGSVFLNIESEYDKKGDGQEKIPYQEKRLGMVMAGDKPQELFAKAKGVVEYLLYGMNMNYEWRNHEVRLPWASTVLAADLYSYDKLLGTLAIVDQRIAKSAGLKREAAVLEISLDKLIRLNDEGNVRKYEEEAKFPSVVRDLAFVLPEKILYSELRGEMLKFDHLIKEAEVFDVYQGDQLGEGLKSLAFHVVYQADRTLTGDEVENLQKSLLKHLAEKFDAKLRDF
jgi:phenylalanyl-tRNA synthetase beta chain